MQSVNHSNPTMPPRATYSIDEAGAVLGTKRSHIYSLISKGILRSVKVGGRRLIPVASLNEMLASAMAEAEK